MPDSLPSFGVSPLRAMVAALVLLATVSVARAAEPEPARETFVVQPFANARETKSLSYLETAVPALIAERFSHHGPLRFAGGPRIFPAPNSRSTAKWVVEGEFDRLPDWRVQVRVKIRGPGDEAPAAEAVREGAKDAAAQLGLEAAAEAFAALPEVKLPAAPATLTAAFGRDPYAFVLYGRGLAQLLGKDVHGAVGDKAVQLFKRSLVIDPKVPETRRYLGSVHLEAGRPGHARAMFSYVLDLKPNYVTALAALAALDRAAGMPVALERYARLIELVPDDGDARRNYGELLSEAGELVHAQEHLQQVVAAMPGDLRARRSLALVLAARRAGPELVAELEEIVKLAPDDLDARMDLAAAYASVGKAAEAEAVYDDVLQRKPRFAAALKLAGDLARGRGDVKKAADLYGKLRWVAPQDPRPVFLLGAAQYEAGNLDAAERMFSEGSRYPGMMGEAYSNLGAIALRRGNAKEALWLLSRAAKKRPGKATVRYNYAMALHTSNRHAEALNELRTAVTLDPTDGGVRFFAGVVELRLGLIREAEESFREALRLDPRNEDARHNLALLEPLVKPRREGSLSFDESTPIQIEVAPRQE
jgi:tetratricopeptide (TPR) repeat protein